MSRGSFAATLALVVSVGLSGRAFDLVPEYQGKAAFLYQFMRFADWPAVGAGGALHVVVVGPEMVAATFRTSLAGKTVKSKPIVVERLSGDQHQPCDLLFVAAGDVAETATLLKPLRRRPVLTVGESVAFRAVGGMIELRVVDQRVRIRINLEATERAGVRLHPSLLTVADAVTRIGPAPEVKR